MSKGHTSNQPSPPWHCCMYAKNLQFYYTINETEFCCERALDVYYCYWNAWCMAIVVFSCRAIPNNTLEYAYKLNHSIFKSFNQKTQSDLRQSSTSFSPFFLSSIWIFSSVLVCRCVHCTMPFFSMYKYGLWIGMSVCANEHISWFHFWFNANGNLCVFRMHKLLWFFSIWAYSTHSLLCVYGKWIRVCVHIHFMNAFNCILTRTDFYFIRFFSVLLFIFFHFGRRRSGGEKNRKTYLETEEEKEAITLFACVFFFLSEMVAVSAGMPYSVCAVKIDECNEEYLKYIAAPSWGFERPFFWQFRIRWLKKWLNSKKVPYFWLLSPLKFRGLWATAPFAPRKKRPWYKLHWHSPNPLAFSYSIAFN